MSAGLVEQLRGVFFEEAFEGLSTIESALMDLDERPGDVDTLNSVFRAAHSIKGGAGSFGFEAISRFTHGMETLLDELRSGARSVDAASVDVLLRATDHLRALVEAAAEGSDVDQEASARLSEEIDRLLAAGGAPDRGPETEEAEGAGFRVRFEPHRDLMATGNDPVLIFRELGELGQLSVEVDETELPPLETLDPEQLSLRWTLTIRGDVERSALDEVFDWVESDCDLRVEPVSATGEAPEAPEGLAASPAPEARAGDSAPETPSAGVTSHGSSSAAAEEASDALDRPGAPEPEPRSAEPPPTEASPHGPDSVPPPRPPAESEAKPSEAPRGGSAPGRSVSVQPSIRVGIDKVDALMDIVGELVITQSMLCQTEKEFDLSQLDKLRDGLQELTRNTRELQESVMRLRMVPISFVFSRFPRLVRDVRASLGKTVELEMVGEGTEVDKTVSEQLADPLVHLVRNALDHGLEDAAGRVAAGKGEAGHLRLSARHEGGSVVIEVEDDGRGIDPDRVLAKAREKRLVGPEERPPEDRIFDLLFAPGFSTAEQVTAMSGRGVGLDVVARNIRALGGTIDIRSRLGKGSCFTIRLPLTLSILDAQLVRIADQVFILPLLSILESVQVNEAQVSSIAGSASIYRLRDQYVPMVDSSEVLGIRRPTSEPAPKLMVMVEAGGSRAGVLVDELLDQQQVVIKSLDTNFRPVPGVSGATILGDGKVAFIIDVAGFVGLAAGRSAEPARAREERCHE